MATSSYTIQPIGTIRSPLRHPAVGILAIREAMRSNQRIQELEAMTDDLLERGQWTPYRQCQRPAFAEAPREAAASGGD